MADRKTLIIGDPSKGIKVNASVVAQPFREEIKRKVQLLKDQGIGKLYPFQNCCGDSCGCTAHLSQWWRDKRKNTQKQPLSS